MLMLGILFYFVPGKWISMEGDSAGYLNERGREGVLPGYPAFLSFFRNLLGEQHFLDGVVIAQGVLAIACTLVFVMVLQRQFRLMSAECILLYVATMLPFSIYLPESGITHQIMTEGITYAIFYLYFSVVLMAVWTLQFKWYFGSVLLAYVLGLIRSQMLFLQAVGFLLLAWIIFRKCGKGFGRKAAALALAAIVGVLIALLSYKLIYAVVIYDNQKIMTEASRKQEPKVEEQAAEEAKAEEPKTKVQAAEPVYVAQISQDELPSQFNSLIVSRGFFEADREDGALFEDEMMKEIFQRTYELADADGRLYHHMEPGLYMWQNLVYDKMIDFAGQAIKDYDNEHPGERTRSSASIYRELGLRVMFHHFDRYLYHAIRLMIPSFIASVFFQIRPIYLLCHFITLFIYLFAILGAVWILRKRGDRKIVEYTLATAAFLVVMVVIVNLVFIGLQRYVVYGMGIFYCAMYLQLKEILRLCGVKWVEKISSD